VGEKGSGFQGSDPPNRCFDYTALHESTLSCTPSLSLSHQVIMDGNARWAQQQGLPVLRGYEEGVVALRSLVSNCCQWGIPALTVRALLLPSRLRGRKRESPG
jgi:undecaprenyl pyrophosphate synthase